MKIFKILFFSLILFSANFANAKNITVIATGGTIAGAGESAVGSKYAGAKIGIDQVIKSVPNITNLANINAEQLLQINSQDMNNQTWLQIAHRVNELLAKRSVDGVVITHGTDTIEETAYFLNLVVKSHKPVVIVGSMRPATSLSADGALNLYNAVALASDDAADRKGVLVLLNDTVFAARDVTKGHTTNVAAFRTTNSGPIGQVHYGKTDLYYSPTRLHTSKTVFDVKKLTKLPKADIIYAYSDMDAGVVDYSVNAGSKAIIVAGVGDGNVNQETLKKLIEAQKKGMLIVRSARAGAGIVEPNVEINDSELGFVTADNLSPQKARILAIMALTKTNDVKKIGKMFKTY